MKYALAGLVTIIAASVYEPSLIMLSIPLGGMAWMTHALIVGERKE